MTLQISSVMVERGEIRRQRRSRTGWSDARINYPEFDRLGCKGFGNGGLGGLVTSCPLQPVDNIIARLVSSLSTRNRYRWISSNISPLGCQKFIAIGLELKVIYRNQLIIGGHEMMRPLWYGGGQTARYWRVSLIYTRCCQWLSRACLILACQS